MRSLAAAATALAILAFGRPPMAGAQATGPTATPLTTPLPAPAPQPAPTMPAVPTPAPPPTAAPLPTPSASPFHYVLTPPAPAAGSPAITEIAINDQTIHPGGPYVVRVTTSLDVVSVVVQAMGGTYALPPAGPGRFLVNGQVPSGVPFFFLNRWYTATVVAQTADGRTTSAPVNMHLTP